MVNKNQTNNIENNAKFVNKNQTLTKIENITNNQT